jgi:hypothetical protein
MRLGGRSCITVVAVIPAGGIWMKPESASNVDDADQLVATTPHCCECPLAVAVGSVWVSNKKACADAHHWPTAATWHDHFSLTLARLWVPQVD